MAKQPPRTHCKNGHPLTPDNVFVKRDNKRECKICRTALFARLKREKTHCKHGHPLSGENLKIGRNGARICRTCHRRTVKEADRKGLPSQTALRRYVDGLQAGISHRSLVGCGPGTKGTDFQRGLRVINQVRLYNFRREVPAFDRLIKRIMAEKFAVKIETWKRSRVRVAAPAVLRDNGTYAMDAIRYACANVWEPIRNDVIADMILAASEGKFHPKEANAHVAAFVKKYNRDNRHDVGSRWGNLSLDQPIGDDDTGSFYEIIRDDQRLWG